VPKLGTYEETALRRAEIIRYRARHPNMTLQDIGKVFGVSKQTVVTACKQRDEERLSQLVEIKADTAKYVARKLAAFDDLAEHLNKILESDSEHTSARVGAISKLLELHQEEIKLLQHTQILPKDLGLVRFQLNVNFVVETVLGIIAELAPDEARQRDAESRVVRALRGGFEHNGD
jgi:hypothetical protein